MEAGSDEQAGRDAAGQDSPQRHYKRIRTIGRGAFGAAILVKQVEPPKELRVIKRIDMTSLTQSQRLAARKEVEVLHELDHPNIIGYDESFYKSGKLHIVLEYADGGDLGQMVAAARERGERLQEPKILYWFAQILLAIQYTHERKILHRDIKTQNIFLTKDNIIKVGDFGIARSLQTGMSFAQTVVGTPYYMSPEVCEEKPYGKESDVWALGCVLYELCMLQHAFHGEGVFGVVLKIMNGKYTPIDDTYSSDIRKLVSWMLTAEPEKRPSVAQLLHQPCIQVVLGRLLETEKLRSWAAMEKPSAVTAGPEASRSTSTSAVDNEEGGSTSATQASQPTNTNGSAGGPGRNRRLMGGRPKAPPLSLEKDALWSADSNQPPPSTDDTPSTTRAAVKYTPRPLRPPSHAGVAKGVGMGPGGGGSDRSHTTGTSTTIRSDSRPSNNSTPRSAAASSESPSGLGALPYELGTLTQGRVVRPAVVTADSDSEGGGDQSQGESDDSLADLLIGSDAASRTVDFGGTGSVAVIAKVMPPSPGARGRRRKKIIFNDDTTSPSARRECSAESQSRSVTPEARGLDCPTPDEIRHRRRKKGLALLGAGQGGAGAATPSPAAATPDNKEESIPTYEADIDLRQSPAMGSGTSSGTGSGTARVPSDALDAAVQQMQSFGIGPEELQHELEAMGVGLDSDDSEGEAGGGPLSADERSMHSGRSTPQLDAPNAFCGSVTPERVSPAISHDADREEGGVCEADSTGSQSVHDDYSDGGIDDAEYNRNLELYAMSGRAAEGVEGGVRVSLEEERRMEAEAGFEATGAGVDDSHYHSGGFSSGSDSEVFGGERDASPVTSGSPSPHPDTVVDTIAAPRPEVSTRSSVSVRSRPSGAAPAVRRGSERKEGGARKPSAGAVKEFADHTVRQLQRTQNKPSHLKPTQTSHDGTPSRRPTTTRPKATRGRGAARQGLQRTRSAVTNESMPSRSNSKSIERRTASTAVAMSASISETNAAAPPAAPSPHQKSFRDRVAEYKAQREAEAEAEMVKTSQRTRSKTRKAAPKVPSRFQGRMTLAQTRQLQSAEPDPDQVSLGDAAAKAYSASAVGARRRRLHREEDPVMSRDPLMQTATVRTRGRGGTEGGGKSTSARRIIRNAEIGVELYLPAQYAGLAMEGDPSDVSSSGGAHERVAAEAARAIKKHNDPPRKQGRRRRVPDDDRSGRAATDPSSVLSPLDSSAESDTGSTAHPPMTPVTSGIVSTGVRALGVEEIAEIENKLLQQMSEPVLRRLVAGVTSLHDDTAEISRLVDRYSRKYHLTRDIGILVVRYANAMGAFGRG